MKRIKIIALLFFGILLLNVGVLKACEIHFQVDNPKENYQIGDEIIVTVTVELTHRNCPVTPEETQFFGEGIEILGATQWVSVNSMNYARKLKIKITGSDPNSKLSALRECKKDGGSGEITFART